MPETAEGLYILYRAGFIPNLFQVDFQFPVFCSHLMIGHKQNRVAIVLPRFLDF